MRPTYSTLLASLRYLTAQAALSDLGQSNGAVVNASALLREADANHSPKPDSPRVLLASGAFALVGDCLLHAPILDDGSIPELAAGNVADADEWAEVDSHRIGDTERAECELARTALRLLTEGGDARGDAIAQAARALLAATGGDAPDWMRPELIALEESMQGMKTAQPKHAPDESKRAPNYLVCVTPRDALDTDYQAGFSKPWLIQYPDGAVEEFDTEAEACARQVELGEDPFPQD